jgi:hypothetical protein
MPVLDPRSLLINGMHGLGDNVMQRAVIRRYLQRVQGTIYLDSPWPTLYADFDPERLKLIRKESRLRTQRKNAEREAASFYTGPVPRTRAVTVNYRGITARETNSTVLATMLRAAGLEPEGGADFTIPHRPEWAGRARSIFAKIGATKPVLFYRPPTLRQEWLNPARNPEPGAFATLLESIRSRFFLLSVADLEPNVEWLAGVRIVPDHKFHEGELDLDAMLAVMAHSALVFTGPGFATVMAMALSVPSVTVFGGYQPARSLAFAPPRVPTLFIEPIKPCDCYRHAHDCPKALNLPFELTRLHAFVGGLTPAAV